MTIVTTILPYISAFPVASFIIILTNFRFFDDKPSFWLSVRAMLGPILLTC